MQLIIAWFDWLFTILRSTQDFSLIWRRHNCRWKAAKFRPMLGAQGLWAGRDLYRATPTVTRGLSFSSLVRRTAPFSRLLRHACWCGGSITKSARLNIHGVTVSHLQNSWYLFVSTKFLRMLIFDVCFMHHRKLARPQTGSWNIQHYWSIILHRDIFVLYWR
jgi:hypothetical protein